MKSPVSAGPPSEIDPAIVGYLARYCAAGFGAILLDRKSDSACG